MDLNEAAKAAEDAVIAEAEKHLGKDEKQKLLDRVARMQDRTLQGKAVVLPACLKQEFLDILADCARWNAEHPDDQIPPLPKLEGVYFRTQ